MDFVTDLTRDCFCLHSAAVGKGDKVIVMPAPSGSGYGYSEALNLYCLLLPNFNPDGDNTLVPVQFAQRDLQLMENFLNVINFPDLGFEKLLDLTNVPTWRLDYNDVSSLSSDLTCNLLENGKAEIEARAASTLPKS